ncbi:MAG: two-component hybrid sensor and response regulator histidine kinase, partial [Nitrospirae bacterium]|nr:two-component hybrid sensor and response regulator histidine kinase [Nitrospirota bacterium]
MVMLAVVPALALLLYTGMEQRRQSIEEAEHDLLLLTRAMVEAQKDITASTRQILSTLSVLPEVQTLDSKACREIFESVLERNPDYLNITLTDLSGEVLASGRTFTATNLRDRKHFREALERKDFAVGEYIISRVGPAIPAFAFAYPVLDKQNRPTAVLTMAIRLAHFSRFHDVQNLPDKSFVAVTDHQGIRLFYYPPNEKTNPIGKPIKATSWELAIKTEKPGVFISESSDGVSRMFAFEQVRLAPNDTPYIYVWAGIPEARILESANAALFRNMLLMLLATVSALFISWIIGNDTLIAPIKSLVLMTRKFAEGNLEAR